jgi:hypothetical protein
MVHMIPHKTMFTSLLTSSEDDEEDYEYDSQEYYTAVTGIRTSGLMNCC